MLNSSVLSSPKSQINFVKAWWHMRFLMQFLSHSPMQANATFITSEKKVAISLWFRVPCLLQFPKNWHQVASSFEHVPNMRDIVARNCTEIAASLHAQCNDTTWAWQNLHWKVRQKLHQNRTCKRAFRLLTVYSLLYDWRLWGNNSLWSGQLYTHTLFCNTCKKCSSIFFYKPVS